MSYRPGDYLVISDISGLKFLRSECRFGEGIQKGLLMHKSEWAPEQPQLNLHPQQDKIAVSDPRPRQPVRWAAGQGPNDPKISF